jgi:cysteine synthase
MAEHRGRYWFPAQFDNPDNPKAHYKSTGPELWNQMGGKVDAFIASQGTGGVLSGIGRYLREKNPKVRLYAVEPSEAPILSHSKWGTHKIEGIGDGFVPKNLDLSLLTGVVTTSSDEAIDMTRRLTKEEGIFCGISSGCNVAAAVKLARKHQELGRIATVINDSGGRYLSTEVFGMKKKQTVTRTSKKLDLYTVEQLTKYQKGFDIVE